MNIIRYLVLATILLSIFPLAVELASVRFYTIDMALFPLVLFTAMYTVAGKEGVLRRGPKVQNTELLFLLFLTFVCVSTVFSVNTAESMNGMLLWLRLLLFYWCIRKCAVAGRIYGKDLYRISYFAVLILITVGLVQLVGPRDFGVIANYFGDNTESISLFRSRISGTSRNSNVYGMWLIAFSVPLFLQFLLSGTFKFLNVLVLGLVLVLVFATGSKSSLLFLMFTIVVTFGIAKSYLGIVIGRSFFLIIFLCGAFGIFIGTPTGFLVVEEFLGRVYNFESASYTERTGSVAPVTQLMSDARYLIIGTGANVYFETLDAVGIAHETFRAHVDAASNRAGIHNFTLNAFTSFGLIAVTAFTISYLFVILKTLRALKNSAYTLPVAVSGVLLIGVLVPAQVNTVSWSVNFAPLLVYCLAITTVHYQLSIGSPKRQSVRS